MYKPFSDNLGLGPLLCLLRPTFELSFSLIMWTDVWCLRKFPERANDLPQGKQVNILSLSVKAVYTTDEPEESTVGVCFGAFGPVWTSSAIDNLRIFSDSQLGAVEHEWLQSTWSWSRSSILGIGLCCGTTFSDLMIKKLFVGGTSDVDNRCIFSISADTFSTVLHSGILITILSLANGCFAEVCLISSDCIHFCLKLCATFKSS